MKRYRDVIKRNRLQRKAEATKDQEESAVCKLIVENSVDDNEKQMEGRDEEKENKADLTDAEAAKPQEDGAFKEDERNSDDMEDFQSDDVDTEQDEQKEFIEVEQERTNTKKVDHADFKTEKNKLKKRSSSVSFTSLNTLPTIAENDEGWREGQHVPTENITSRRDSGFHGARVERRNKRKPNVSYSDLIKLQHTSSNTRLLFKLVDELALKTGIQEKRRRIPDIRDHVHFRGESPAMASTFTKTAAVFYPIRFGYDAAPETCPDIIANNGQTTAEFQPVSRVIHPYDKICRGKPIPCVNSDGLNKTIKISRSHPKRKSELSLASLVEEVNKIKSVHKYTQYSTQKTQSLTDHPRHDVPATRKKPRSLPPIGGHPSDRHENENSNKVAWQSALAKIKTVHTLVNWSWMF